MLSEKADGKMAKAGMMLNVSKISSMGESCNICLDSVHNTVYRIKCDTSLILRICPDCLRKIKAIDEEGANAKYNRVGK